VRTDVLACWRLCGVEERRRGRYGGKLAAVWCVRSNKRVDDGLDLWAFFVSLGRIGIADSSRLESVERQFRLWLVGRLIGAERCSGVRGTKIGLEEWKARARGGVALVVVLIAARVWSGTV